MEVEALVEDMGTTEAGTGTEDDGTLLEGAHDPAAEEAVTHLEDATPLVDAVDREEEEDTIIEDRTTGGLLRTPEEDLDLQYADLAREGADLAHVLLDPDLENLRAKRR